MLNPKIVMEEPPESSLTSSVKFYRRLELDSKTRLDIAYQAMNASWGKITQLSEKYQVSRKFVYEQLHKLQNHLEPVFGLGSPSIRSESSLWLWILQFRLIGRNSLYSIKDLLKTLPIKPVGCSIGYISQVLQQIGNSLSNTIEWQGSCVIAMDELFVVGHEPILVTVDIQSGAILRLDLHSSLLQKNWEDHWTGLLQRGITPLKVISDEGTVLQAARKTVLKEVRFQPDTFHAVSHRLGLFKTRLFQQAEAAIRVEYGRETRLSTVKSETTRIRVEEEWQKAKVRAQESIQKYEDLSFLYHCILAQFNVFKAHGGLRQRKKAEQEVEAALFYLRTLPVKGLSEELDSIQKLLPQLFDFLDTAQEGIQQLETFVDPEALPYWTQAWQVQKKATKIKKYSLKKKYLGQYSENIAFLNLFYENWEEPAFLALQERIFKILDITSSQASSAVENANSFIRPFLDQARGQIEQHTLNLILFYYNHRRFSRGKRKGQSPIEILTGRKSEQTWQEILLAKL